MNDLEMSWNPFGLTLTYQEFSDLLAWYIERHSKILYTKEEDYYAF